MKERTLLQALRLIASCDRSAFCLRVCYTVLQSLLPLANLYVVKLLVDQVTLQLTGAQTPNPASLIPYILSFCLLFLLNRIVGALSSVNNDLLTQKLIDHINGLIQDQSVRLDMAYYDNPQFHDTFHRAQQEAAFRPVRILDSAISILGALISLVGVLAMLCSASWSIILIMVVAVVPSFLVRLFQSRRIYAFRRATTQDLRRSSYYGSVLSGVTFAKEVRLFGLAPHFRQKYLAIRRQLVQRLLRISRRLALLDVATSVVETLALALVILVLAWQAAASAITVGSFVMLFEAFRRGQGYMSSLVSGVSGLYEHKLFITNLFEFLRLQPAILTPDHPEPFPEKVEEIIFRDISFHYPQDAGDSPRWVLQHFNLTARMGAVTLLEGENGFGKSTLLKLLLRLYDPQQGAILLNGVDIRRYDLQQLRSHISVIFQDHVRFYCSARENIEFGDLSHSTIVGSPDTEGRLQQAIHLAGAQPVIDSLSQGLDTPLGRMFDHGEELSMGQWQRLALARQLYSTAPILVFDEPTAWMDAASRRHFQETLQQLTPNHLIILINHQ